MLGRGGCSLNSVSCWSRRTLTGRIRGGINLSLPPLRRLRFRDHCTVRRRHGLVLAFHEEAVIGLGREEGSSALYSLQRRRSETVVGVQICSKFRMGRADGMLVSIRRRVFSRSGHWDQAVDVCSTRGPSLVFELNLSSDPHSHFATQMF